MKKFISVLLLLCVFAVSIPVQASEGTTYTYTISVDGDWIRTQDAYLPGRVLLQGYGLSQPSDMFIKGNKIYIADTGNSRIIIYDIVNESVELMGEGDLKSPRGIFVDDAGTVYVADYDAEAVFILSREGKILNKIGRPDSYLFSKNSRYKPTNVAVTSGGIILVTGEGAYEGIMQFNTKGEFQGYFAANSAGITALQRIQEMFFTKEQLNRLFKRTPRAIQNIDITDRDLILSVTQDAGISYAWRKAEESKGNNVKLHNFDGVDILKKTDDMVDEWNFTDIAAGPYGNSYALTYTGIIDEYDSEGNLVFSFSGRAVSSEKSGLFTYASAIDLDDQGMIYVLDRERALIQVFYPTEFAAITHKAISELKSGNYDASESTWKSLLRLNGMSRIAHNGYGKTLYYKQRFNEAMDHFYLAGNRNDYSEAFWEIRDVWINKNAPYGIIIIAAMYIIYTLLKLILRKMGLINKKRKKEGRRGIFNDLLYLRNMIRHPIDSFYYLKRGEKGSTLGATAIYGLMFLIYLWDRLFRGFIFNSSDIYNTSLFSVGSIFFVPAFLWIIGNYMVGSINEGEGSLRSVYIGTAYACAPYVLFMPLVLLLTYILTINEIFLIQFSWIFFICWSGVLIFLGVIEIHNYTVKEATKNILITLFFVIMAVVGFAILYIIWGQVWEFIKTVGGEVKYRAFY